ncbi:MAG TPA: PAS domain S-box protein [Puia sp.]|uniref:PAS domain S-box protein n=1 Tax=Puia sp. TaxID=2045100 RepID=UPI002D1A7FBE|nr:PAS domain S-box protein [Puia sp.]HVU94394.1 PAS domain S-box protein [Puia sp.]
MSQLFWPKKIRTQLILGIALVHLVLMSVFVADLLNRQYTFLVRQGQDQALGLAHDLAINANIYIVGNDFDGLERMIQSYKDFPHLEYAMILSPENTVVSHTDPANLGKTATDSISRSIGSQPKPRILTHDNHILDVAAPVIRDKALIGWARVAINQDYIFGNLAGIVEKGILYILIAIATGAIIAILIGKRLTGGLYKLIAASEKIRSGDHNIRATRSGGYELDLLATTFNRMLDEIVANESRLKDSEAKFRSLVEQSQVGVYIAQDEKFVYVNPVFEQQSGYAKEELIGKATFYMLVHEEDLPLVRRNYEQRMSTGRSTDRYVLRAIRRDGAIIFVEVIVSTIVYNNAPAVIGSIIDITDRLHEENRINKAVIDAQERERMQIGMELHDNVQQLLAGSILTLDYVRSRIAAGGNPQNIADPEALDNVKAYINEGITELRRLSHQLAPSMRLPGNLSEKIHALVQTMNIANSFESVEIEVDDFDTPLNAEVQLAFYRILQEQLTNILKYADATRVSIRVKRVGQQIILSIRDNGRGFDPTEKREGIGFENIRRRATAMEGTLKINSSAGAGCELSLRVGAF